MWLHAACIIGQESKMKDETRHFPVNSVATQSRPPFQHFFVAKNNNLTMEDENVASSTTAPAETAEGGDGGATKCSVCKKRLGRKSECFNISSCFSRHTHLVCFQNLFLPRKSPHLIAVLVSLAIDETVHQLGILFLIQWFNVYVCLSH